MTQHTSTDDEFWWVPTRHTCGHGVAIGARLADHDEHPALLVASIVTLVSSHACVKCGTDGDRHLGAIGAEPVYHVANGVWLRALRSSEQSPASENARRAVEYRRTFGV